MKECSTYSRLPAPAFDASRGKTLITQLLGGIGTPLCTLLLTLLLPLLALNATAHTITVLQWNIWQEGTMIQGGYDAIVDEIVRLRPDFVTFSEVRNYHNTRFCDRITKSLRERGEEYWAFYSYDTGLLSRHPITDSLTVFPCVEDHGSIYGLHSIVAGHKVAVYTAHLDYLNDSYYEARGYDGCNFRPIVPVNDPDSLIAHGNRSMRDEAVRAFLQQAEADTQRGYTVIIGGDFNEPSHRDWTSLTADLYDHHGAVVPWPQTTALEAAGFIDAYRTRYPNVLTHPGFTYPSDNTDAPINRLTWAPKADERERIDYVFIRPAEGRKISLKDCRVFGPEGCIVRSERMAEPSRDARILPLGTWPTDHKGVWVKVKL